MAYNTAGLHRAGTDHHELAAGIDPIVSQIGRLIVEAGVLGLLSSAATFATALDHARLGCATAAAREVDDRARQGQRTTAAAMLADKLTLTTTQVASRPGDLSFILQGMK